MTTPVSRNVFLHFFLLYSLDALPFPLALPFAVYTTAHVSLPLLCLSIV